MIGSGFVINAWKQTKRSREMRRSIGRLTSQNDSGKGNLIKPKK
jgi:hypothetical protein